mmetsp:Transcript_15662/g.33329  ORF Transcript_15662/g.33329 Transcript_15662/m.33329 type:complete len:220 (+) Transcript_15662:369-1028(+)
MSCYCSMFYALAQPTKIGDWLAEDAALHLLGANVKFSVQVSRLFRSFQKAAICICVMTSTLPLYFMSERPFLKKSLAASISGTLHFHSRCSPLPAICRVQVHFKSSPSSRSRRCTANRYGSCLPQHHKLQAKEGPCLGTLSDERGWSVRMPDHLRAVPTASRHFNTFKNPHLPESSTCCNFSLNLCFSFKWCRRSKQAPDQQFAPCTGHCTGRSAQMLR